MLALTYALGLAILGIEIGNFCGFLYTVLLLSMMLRLDFLGLALFRPQVSVRAPAGVHFNSSGTWLLSRGPMGGRPLRLPCGPLSLMIRTHFPLHLHMRSPEKHLLTPPPG